MLGDEPRGAHVLGHPQAGAVGPAESYTGLQVE
jgi:hypothetical protein